MALAAFAGDGDLARSLISSTIREVGARGEGIGIAVALDKRVAAQRLGQYPEARAAAKQALHHQQYPYARYPGGELGTHRLVRSRGGVTLSPGDPGFYRGIPGGDRQPR